MTHARITNMIMGLVAGAVLCVAALGTAAAQQPDVGVTAAEVTETLESIGGLTDIAAEFEGPILVVRGVANDEEARDAADATLESLLDPDLFRNDITLSTDFGDRFQGAATRVSQKADQLLGYLPLVPVALGVLLAAFVIAWLIGKFNGLFRRFIRNPFLSDIAMRGVQLAVLFIGALIALEVLDAVALIGGVLGAAGVLGLAIGFAFKDLAENYIASILLSLRQPFRPKDHVVIDSHEGLVTSMNTRTTVLTTFDGNVVRIPNATVFKTSLINYTTDSRRRFSFTVGVGYDVDLHHAIRTGIEVLGETEGVLGDPGPSGMITELGDSSITIRLLGWVDQHEHEFGMVRSFAMQRVKSRFDELDIDMPEPIYKIKIAPRGEQTTATTTPAASQPELEQAPQPMAPDRTAEIIADSSRRGASGNELLDGSADPE